MATVKDGIRTSEFALTAAVLIFGVSLAAGFGVKPVESVWVSVAGVLAGTTLVTVALLGYIKSRTTIKSSQVNPSELVEIIESIVKESDD